jgi:hypothetical protein
VTLPTSPCRGVSGGDLSASSKVRQSSKAHGVGVDGLVCPALEVGLAAKDVDGGPGSGIVVGDSSGSEEGQPGPALSVRGAVNVLYGQEIREASGGSLTAGRATPPFRRS